MVDDDGFVLEENDSMEEGDSMVEDEDSTVEEDSSSEEETNQQQAAVLSPLPNDIQQRIADLALILRDVLQPVTVDGEEYDFASIKQALGDEQWRLLQAICNFTNRALSCNKEKLRVSLSIDDLVAQHCAHFCGKYHMLKAVLVYTTTHSRTAVEIISHSSAFPSYTTVRNWFLELGGNRIEPLDVTERKDLVIAFDNNQVVGKTWRISSHGQPISVVTTRIGVSLEGSSWQFLQNVEVNLICAPHLLPRCVVAYKDTFLAVQHRVMAHMIRQVTLEMNGRQSHVIDYAYELFNDIGASRLDRREKKAFLMEPKLINPNSVRNVALVLRRNWPRMPRSCNV
jgi:hypothetical protein